MFDYLALERSKGTFPRYEFHFNTAGTSVRPRRPIRNASEFDPAFFDRANLEALVAANPNLGREINLINNDLKVPYSDQFSLGVRNRFDLWQQNWNTSATVSYVEAKDGIVFLLGNRRGNGSYRENPLAQWEQVPFGNGIPGPGHADHHQQRHRVESDVAVAVGREAVHERNELGRHDRLHVHGRGGEPHQRRPERRALHPRLSRQSLNSAGTPRPACRSIGLVATGIWGAPWDLTLSAKLLLQSPVQFEALNCLDVPTAAERPPGLGANNFCFFDNFKPDTTIGRKQFDLAIDKDFDLGDFTVGLRADVLNVFNWENPDTYENFRGFDGVPNAAYGRATAWRQPTRTFKLSFNVSWR